ncbi:MAG TPA: hypothetical protein VE422_46290 [Terriglobia bacterium]|nr:hypothetical protein [Terriglobia bacterium]
MKMRKGTVVVAIMLALILSVSALAQRRNQQQQQQQQQQRGGQAEAQAQQIGPQPTSKDELDAFVALQNEQNAAAKLAKGDEFVEKFPNSDFVSYAHTFRMISLSQMGKSKESAAAAEQALSSTIKLGEKVIAKAEADSKLTDKDKEAARKKDKNVVFVDKSSPQFQQFMAQMDQRIMAFYQSMIQSYQQLNDAAKMMEVADKALAYKPDDLNTLVMLSNVMAERPPTSEDQRKTHLARAEELARQGITQLPIFISSPEGSQLNNEQKADLASNLHYTLGLIYLHQKRFSDSEKEFGIALQAKANDPITYYRLGIAYAQDLKNDQAMEALAKSVFLKGVSEANAREILKQLYVQKNKSEQGLEDYIKSAGQKIGQ